MTAALKWEQAQDRCEELADALCADIKKLEGYTPSRRWLDAKRLRVFDRRGDPIATFYVEPGEQQ